MRKEWGKMREKSLYTSLRARPLVAYTHKMINYHTSWEAAAAIIMLLSWFRYINHRDLASKEAKNEGEKKAKEKSLSLSSVAYKHKMINDLISWKASAGIMLFSWFWHINHRDLASKEAKNKYKKRVRKKVYASLSARPSVAYKHKMIYYHIS